MTDRELLELAAKAAGITVATVHEHGLYLTTAKWWNPLTDDGDALKLAVKLAFINPGCFPSPAFEAEKQLAASGDVDWYAATRRAIVRAAAEIGATK